jgi:hypothetical protein
MDDSRSDRSSWYRDEYAEDVRDFVLRHGAVEYLSFLSQGPRRFVEMQNELTLGDGTLLTLQTDAEELGLEEIDQQKRDGELYRIHQLSLMGRVVVDQMHGLGVTQRHERLRTIRQEYKQSKEDYLDWAEGPGGLVAYIEEHVEEQKINDDLSLYGGSKPNGDRERDDETNTTSEDDS